MALARGGKNDYPTAVAIPIIGETKPSPKKTLPSPPTDLPSPEEFPALAEIIEDEHLERLLTHENVLVRHFALEQLNTRKDEKWNPAIVQMLADTDESLAAEATSLIEDRKISAAIDLLLERFENASGELGERAASALGTLAPEKLLPAIQARGRMDNETYNGAIIALSLTESADAESYLDKALNRAGAQKPERKISLFNAALLSGRSRVVGRVLDTAISDTKENEPEDGTYPSRVALADFAMLPRRLTAEAEGLEVYDYARERFAEQVRDLLQDDEHRQLEEAFKKKNTGEVFVALQPLLKIEVEGTKAELEKTAKRRKTFLDELFKRHSAFSEMEPKKSALFLAAATQALSAITNLQTTGDRVLASLATALEYSTTEKDFASLTEEELQNEFAKKSSREMRRVIAMVTRERFERFETLQQITSALVRASHGELLLEAASQVDDPSVHHAVVTAFSRGGEAAEEVLVQNFSDRDIEKNTLMLAAVCAEHLRTKRIAMAIGRRFLALRRMARPNVIRAMIRLGDEALIPVLKSRAFPHETEEAAWAILSLVHGKEQEENVSDATKRILSGSKTEAENARLRVPLECQACEEVFEYGFDQALVDIEAKDNLGDPAFVGETTCKACGTDDQLTPTDEGAQILTTHMLRFLDAVKAGRSPGAPLVAPAQTTHDGKKLGINAALRALNQDLETSPDSIRYRLNRARILLMLKRKKAEEDIQAALTADPNSIEAKALNVSLAMRDHKFDEAMASCSSVVREARNADEPPRLYSESSANGILEQLEELMVDLAELGQEVPSDISLDQARQRIVARSEAQA